MPAMLTSQLRFSSKDGLVVFEDVISGVVVMFMFMLAKSALRAAFSRWQPCTRMKNVMMKTQRDERRSSTVLGNVSQETRK